MSIVKQTLWPGQPRDSAFGAMVRQEVARILTSPHFTASDRLRRFLRFVVEETLEGRQDRIKAFTIAVDVFGRDGSFDAQNDPVVRIEAGRLRRALQHFYLVDREAARVVIDIPKGGYVPSFLPAGAPDSTSAAYGQEREPAVETPADPRPAIVVLPFVNFGPSSGGEFCVDGIADELLASLGCLDSAVVLGGTMGQAINCREQAAKYAALYAIEGSIRSDGTLLRIGCRLFQAPDGVVLWTRTFEVPLTIDLFHLPCAIAARIAADIMGPVGLQLGPSMSETNALRHGAAYAAVEARLARSPEDATALAVLNLLALDEIRLGFNPRHGHTSALDHARSAAKGAFAGEPEKLLVWQRLIGAPAPAENPRSSPGCE